ncbi:MAG TPA: MFS transporter [Candidatus Udaeobacter sp.]|nr:MFS transporter [Candidatus Udaeobacter sp.]
MIGVPSRATAPVTASSAEQTRRRVAARLLPFVFVLYIINYLDRTSVAYGAIGMSRALGFDDRVLGLGIGIFFLSYVALQIPGAVLAQRWSARGVICTTMIVSGSLTALTALVHTPRQLYLARFLLGAAEAGFFPAVIVYLSHWFIQEDRAKATSNFMAAIPVSLVIGSPLAGWILSHNWFMLEGWRWLFLLEGIPAILLGAVAFFFLTDWPNQAHWLSARQREWISRSMEQEKPLSRQSISIAQALRSRTVLLLVSAAFLQYLIGYSVIFWLPTILKSQSGLSDARVGLFAAVPYVVGLFAMLFNAWHSDKRRERRWHAAVPLFIAALGFLCLVSLSSSTVITVSFLSVISMSMAFLPVFWALPTEILSDSNAAFAVGTINALASLAGFAGPFAFGYLRAETGSFLAGYVVLMCCALATGVLVLFTPAVNPRVSESPGSN